MSTLTQNELTALVKAITPNTIESARWKARQLVHGSGSRSNENTCAATLSYLLIDLVGLDMPPQRRAMKLAYILERDFAFERVGLEAGQRPGDVGVVDFPKNARQVVTCAWPDGIPDGDAEDQLQASGYGDGYIEPDPGNRNFHHIYLVAATTQNPEVNLIADNQKGDVHPRNRRGGGHSPTKYFLRAESAAVLQ